MRKILSRSFLASLLAAVFLAGCGPAYYPGDHRYPDDRRYPDGEYGQYGQFGDVRGTIASVNPRARLIYIDREGYGYGDRDDLRNDDRGGGQVVLSYDDGTTVRYQGRTFRPEDLERGDRIQASVDRNDGRRLFAESIDVLYDVSQGGSQGGYGTYGGYDDNRNEDLRGTIRSIDRRAHTLEIDRSPYPNGFAPDASGRYPDSDRDRYDTVQVSYDPHTPVRFQGSVYNPESLERGDEVRIRTRDYDGRLFAQEIVVMRDRRSGG